MDKSTGQQLAVMILLLILQGCSSGYAPVSDRSITYSNNVEIVRSQSGKKTSGKATTLPERYTVKKGDTLYSIAWRYSLDYRNLAMLNNIDTSYRIYVGQTLKLTGRLPASVEKPKTPVQKQPAFEPDDGRALVPVVAVKSTPIKQKITKTVKPKQNQIPKKPTTSKKQTQVAAPVKEKKGSASPAPAAKPNKKPVSSTNIQWRWPAKGRMIQGYSVRGSVNKGINIAGNKGDPVYSASSGRVVYAGNGLLGYGNLIIVNHNQDFLSAYAHNSRILVTEGANVKQGQKIAEMGSSGATRVMLHFEIRKDGKPVNPLKYLPKR